MPVFYDTGGGDIYGGHDRKAVEEAMLEDCAGLDLSKIKEVSGLTKMSETDENEEPTGNLITIADEYGDDSMAYCICTTNN